MLTIREIKKVESLEEAWTLNQKKPNKIIGGMIWLKMETLNIATAIDLSGLGLNTIEETEEEFRIGCMVTLRQIETHPGLDSYSQGAVREAVHHIVGLQLRNLATVGGSVFGRFGFSDVISVLLAMDTYVELYKGGIIPLRDFVNMKYDRDVLVRVIIKKEKASFYYQSVRITKTDFPVLTCAAAKTEQGLRLVYGARPAKPMLLVGCEALNQPITEASIKEITAYAAENVYTETNTRGSAEYRTHLVKGLTQRALKKLGGC